MSAVGFEDGNSSHLDTSTSVLDTDGIAVSLVRFGEL
jgi:hypothetical protein